MGPVPGQRASVRIVVSEADTAIAAGSGDVPVLATPRLLALAEAAAVAALAPHLGPGQTSVGTGVSLEHRRPSPVGTEVMVEADLTEVEGRRLVFSFIARHTRPPDGPPADRPPAGGGPAVAGETGDDLVVGAGTVERVVVDRARFLARLAQPGA